MRDQRVCELLGRIKVQNEQKMYQDFKYVIFVAVRNFWTCRNFYEHWGLQQKYRQKPWFWTSNVLPVEISSGPKVAAHSLSNRDVQIILDNNSSAKSYVSVYQGPADLSPNGVFGSKVRSPNGFHTRIFCLGFGFGFFVWVSDFGFGFFLSVLNFGFETRIFRMF